MEEYMEIGRVVNTHGIHGAFKIVPSTDDPTRYELLDFIFLNQNKTRKKYEIERLHYHKQSVILQCKEVTTMNQAELLKGALVEIPKSMALPLGDDEYYIGDLYGLLVYTTEDEFLGTLTDILFTGSNDVYCVQDPNNPSQKPLLLPAIKQCIKSVDIKNQKMVVHLMEGLKEL